MVVYFIAIMCSNALLQMSSVLILLSVIVLQLKNKKFNLNQFKLLNKIPKILLYSLVIFTISGFLSLFMNVHSFEKILDYAGEYRWIAQFTVLVFIFNNFYKSSWIKKSHLIYIVAIIISLYAIWQSFTGLDLISSKHERLLNYGGMFRSIGPFSITLTLAYVYGFLFFTIFPQLLVSGKSFTTRKKIFLIVTCILFSVVVILTQTRGAWVAFAGAIFVTLILYKPVRKYLLVLLIISPISYFVLPNQIQYRIKSIANVKTDTSNTGRFEIWTAHYRLFQKNKLFGVGMSNNVKQLPNEYKLMGIKKGKVLHAHNNILQILSAQGLVGVIPYLLFTFIFIFMAVKLVSYGASEEIVMIGLISSAVQAYLFIGGLTEATFIDQEVNHPLILTWALTLVVYLKNKYNIPISNSAEILNS